MIAYTPNLNVLVSISCIASALLALQVWGLHSRVAKLERDARIAARQAKRDRQRAGNS